MSIAIGVVMTEHVSAGVLEDQRLTGKVLRFPEDKDECDSLVTLPGGELVDILAKQIAALTSSMQSKIDGTEVADSCLFRRGVE